MVTYEQLYYNSIPSGGYALHTPHLTWKDYLTQANLPGCHANWRLFNQTVDETSPYLLTPYGLSILQDRFLHPNESPKHMIARVANALANTEEEAIEFFNTIHNRKFMPASPILFNAGSAVPQLSSCYIHTVHDSIDGIFKSYTDMAHMGKFSGGIATDWSYVRGIGSLIKGTGRTGQGLLPWLKIQDSIQLAVNQGGRRKGAHCAYLEVWHTEIFEFCKLRHPIGDESRRTHNLHTAVWIPDKFMEAVVLNRDWHLFCPTKAGNLHELTGIEFSIKYNDLVASGAHERCLPARELWRHILTSLYETGHPWITFKDACNRGRPPMTPPILSSNLCTEITLPTSFDNTAVCTLSSLNLAAHKGLIDLEETTRIAINFLNRIIDKSWYPTTEAKYHAETYRSLGLGVMGYQDALHQRSIVWGSSEHEAYDHETFRTIQIAAWEENHDNHTLTAIAPTATISYIVGVSPSIEPYFANIYSPEGLSGTSLMAGIGWLTPQRTQQEIDSILAGKSDPNPLYRTAFEIPQELLIEAAARRQKYICQSQSLNLYVNHQDGKALSDLYIKAWKDGLKTTYYLRTKSATSRGESAGGLSSAETLPPSPLQPPQCPPTQDCEACQ